MVTPFFISVALIPVLLLQNVDSLECGYCHQVERPEECTDRITCDLDSMCSTLEQHSVTWRKVYRLQCTTRKMCETMDRLQQHGVNNLCVKCCNTGNCNLLLCGNDTTTSQTPTTSTTPRTMATHKHYVTHDTQNPTHKSQSSSNTSPGLTHQQTTNKLHTTSTTIKAHTHSTHSPHAQHTQTTHAPPSATTAILRPPVVQPTSHYSVELGGTIGLLCNASGSGDIIRAWSLNGNPNLPENVNIYTDYIVILGATYNNTGWYICHVSNAAGDAYSQTYLAVRQPTTPTTTTTPKRTATTPPKPTPTTAYHVAPMVTLAGQFEVHEGDNITITCHVTASPPPKISWDFNAVSQHNINGPVVKMIVFKKGVNMDGQQGHPLGNVHVHGNKVTIVDAQMVNMGWYSCIAQNQYGVDYAVSELTVIQDQTTKVTTPTPTVTTTHRLTTSTTTRAPTSHLTTTAPPYLITTHVQAVWHGDNLTVTCREIASHYMPLSWSVLVGTLASNVKFSGPKMTVTEAKPYNEGIYKCSAHDGSHDLHEYTHIYVRGSKPKVSSILSPKMSETGTYSYVVCETTGHPEPEVYFEHIPLVDNRRPTKVDTFDVTQRLHLVKNGNKTMLLISRVIITDNGIYRCVATNFYGRDTSYVFMKVINPVTTTPAHTTAKPVPPSITMATQETSLYGYDEIISCHVTGVPQPHITWYFNQSRNLPTNALQHGDSLLVHKATPADDGVYKCRAENSAGSAESELFLTVFGMKPFIGHPLKSEIKTEGSYLILTCDASGLPRPSITWSYVPLLHHEVKNWPDGVSLLHSNTTLVIPNVEPVHQGLYTCHAQNEFGSDESHATFIVTPPSTPGTSLVG